MLVRRVRPARPTFDSPFADFEQVRREMQRLLDTVSGEPPTDAASGVFPPLNVTQDNDSFYVRAEIPGISPDQLSITAVHNRLSISGKREIPKENDRVSWHRKERAEGSFSRSLTLPSDVATERVDASYSNGILTVKLPKADETKPRQITVRS